MNRDLITRLFRSFEDIAHREGDVEFWLARELQELLSYDRWENFTALLDRARTACEKGGQPILDHFREVTKMVVLGSGPSFNSDGWPLMNSQRVTSRDISSAQGSAAGTHQERRQDRQQEKQRRTAARVLPGHSKHMDRPRDPCRA